MDTMRTIFLYGTAFLMPVLLKIEGTISLVKLIVGEDNNMTGFEIFETVSLPIAFVGVFWYFDRRFKKTKKELTTYIDTHRKDSHEITMMLALISDRRDKHIKKCIQAGKIIDEPMSWLTSEEKRLHQTYADERRQTIEKIFKSLSSDNYSV